LISIRQSAAEESNDQLKEVKPEPNETNSAWLKRVGATDGLLLLGGASISDFRVRVAQAHARADLTPSTWSLVGILLDGQTFLSVPLELSGPANEIALGNGVHACSVADYDDPEQYPNIAVVRFTPDNQKIVEFSKLVGGNPETGKPAQRNIIDLPTLMLPWLSYIWIAGKASNPLSEGLGLPSAAFVETVYGMAGIELTPGLASATSCPEAIWQAAKYWHDFYEEAIETTNEKNATQQIPTGSFALRQMAAAVTWPRQD
jgi:hypothetical protein